MIRYSKQVFFPTIPIVSMTICAMFVAGFLMNLDLSISLLHISVFSPRASGTCSPCVAAKGHGMAMCDEVASLVIADGGATKSLVRTAVCSNKTYVLDCIRVFFHFLNISKNFRQLVFPQ